MWVRTYVMYGEYSEVVIETARSHSSEEGGKERESGKRREKKKGKKEKGGKGFWGIVGVFGFLIDCVFSLHPFCPPFSIHHATTLHHHALTHPTTVHTTPRHTQHATQPRVCAVMFVVCVSLSLCVAVCPLFPHSTQTTPRHPITLSTTHDTTNA